MIFEAHRLTVHWQLKSVLCCLLKSLTTSVVVLCVPISSTYLIASTSYSKTKSKIKTEFTIIILEVNHFIML
jgi:hypothetical protein